MDTEPQEEAEDQVTEMDAAMEEAAEATPEEQPEESHDVEQEEHKTVPVSAVQRERKKRQEEREQKIRAEAERDFYRQQLEVQKQQPVEEDDSQWESTTRGDLQKFEQQTNERISKTSTELKRDIREDLWAESNPEKSSYVLENLEDFLTNRPHYRAAIDASSNRYKEAYELMTAFNQRNSPQARKRKVAPNSPASVPKSAPSSGHVDPMSFDSDAEFNAWRQEQRRKRSAV